MAIHRALPLALVLAAAAAPAWANIEFSPCELKTAKAFSGPKAECARVEVPENHAEPDGRKISLRLARVMARAGEPAADPIVFLAGGPGQSAVESWPQLANAYQQLLATRDVLLLDQRGTGDSHLLRCPFPDLLDPMATKLDREELQKLASDCLPTLDADVRHYGTRDYIADLEYLRKALDVDKWNLVGGSYGTRVALSYVQAHPDSLRSVVLDGVAPQEVALGIDHGVNLDTALAEQFQRCRDDRACREAFGDPAATLAELRQRWSNEPTTVIVADPRSRAPVELPLNHDVLAGVVRMYAYSPETAALLPLLLHQAREGDPQPLVSQALTLFADMDDMIAHGMQLSVICGEDAPWMRADPNDTSLIGPDLVNLMLAQCEVWPTVRAPAAFKQPVDSDLPILLLSGQYDPVTPPSYAERALATLSNAKHLVVPGQGHIVQGRGCLPRLMTQFIRQADFDDFDTACVDQLKAPPFFLDFNGGEP